jgi:hypothetical protein
MLTFQSYGPGQLLPVAWKVGKIRVWCEAVTRGDNLTPPSVKAVNALVNGSDALVLAQTLSGSLSPIACSVYHHNFCM